MSCYEWLATGYMMGEIVMIAVVREIIGEFEG